MNRTAAAYWISVAAAAAPLAAPAAASASTTPQEYRTATWYADRPAVREHVNALCREDPGHAQRNADCANAAQGDVVAALRETERRNSGNLTPPTDPRYWTLHPEEARYRQAMCPKIAPEFRAANYCDVVQAATTGRGVRP